MKEPKAKVSKIFRLNPLLVARLEKHSSKTRITQTAIVEAALREFLAIKR